MTANRQLDSFVSAGEAEGPGTSLALVPGLRPPTGAPPELEPLLLRPLEAARLLGIGRSKLFEMMARDELPVVRMGRCVRIPRHELAAWIDEQARADMALKEAFMGAGAIRRHRMLRT